ncbi:hypothetical protein ACHAW6_002329, partial [Cyclotella cf. meneghiniana]
MVSRKEYRCQPGSSHCPKSLHDFHKHNNLRTIFKSRNNHNGNAVS